MSRPIIVVPEGMAWCGKCRTPKPRSEFFRETRRWNGLRGTCKACSKAYTQAWLKKNPTFHRRHQLKRCYDLTLEEYAVLHAAQDGLCAICGQTQNGRDLFVDHDHVTGRVRGLLCSICNQFLGRIQDDPSRLVAYLEVTGV